MANLTEAERITRLETEMNHVATKADVAAVRNDMQAVRTDMAHMQTSIIKWMAGMVIGIVLSVGLGVVNLLVRVLDN